MSEVAADTSGTKVPDQRPAAHADDHAADHDRSGERNGAGDQPDEGRHRRHGDRGGPVDERGERPLERADRNMVEMLQELRVAQTGVQILFAFLLSMSFTERFARIDDFQRWTYVTTLLLSALTTGLIVAPAAIHRMLFGRGVKAFTVRIGHRLFVAGLVALALTLVGAVLLVLDVAVGRTFAAWCAAAVGVLLVGLWFLLPLPVRARNERSDSGPGGDDKE
jgi:Family of unknown function (DUF6328)